MSDNMMKVKNDSPKKARLGRGIGSLLGGPIDSDLGGGDIQFEEPKAKVETALSENQLDTQRIWQIEVHKLKANQRQPRKHFAKEHLQELADSIRAQGILQPITARRLSNDEFEIIAGERRWRAAQLAGLQQVPVVIKKVDDRDSLELALIENIQRQELNAIEEALAYQRLANEFNLTQAEISQKVGKDRVTIANTLRLLALAPQVQQMVVEARISMGHARALLQIGDQVQQIELANKVASAQMTVRETERLANRLAKGPKEEKPADPKAELAAALAHGIAEELQKLIGSKVSIDYNSGKGKLSINFYSDEELNQMVDNLRNAWQRSVR